MTASTSSTLYPTIMHVSMPSMSLPIPLSLPSPSAPLDLDHLASTSCPTETDSKMEVTVPCCQATVTISAKGTYLEFQSVLHKTVAMQATTLCDVHKRIHAFLVTKEFLPDDLKLDETLAALIKDHSHFKDTFLLEEVASEDTKQPEPKWIASQADFDKLLEKLLDKTLGKVSMRQRVRSNTELESENAMLRATIKKLKEQEVEQQQVCSQQKEAIALFEALKDCREKDIKSLKKQLALHHRFLPEKGKSVLVEFTRGRSTFGKIVEVLSSSSGETRFNIKLNDGQSACVEVTAIEGVFGDGINVLSKSVFINC
jgi:hypothetical protein